LQHDAAGRNVRPVMATEPDPNAERRPRPILGILSLAGFAVSATAAGFIFAAGTGKPDFQPLGYVLGAIIVGAAGGLSSWLAASIGIMRKESPRWPAIVGFVLSFGPAMGAVFIIVRLLAPNLKL
jgi:hypothetical protein